MSLGNLFKSQHASSGTYWPELDGIRTLAFLLVFICHMGVIPCDSLDVGIIRSFANAYNAIALWGWMGVDLFFVLSAFLITTLLLKERANYGSISFKLFFIRRMFRIWPLYYLMLIVGFFVLPCFNWMGVSIGSYGWKKMLETHLLTFFAFVANFQISLLIRYMTPFFPAFWSINVEEQFYTIWGLTLRYVENKKMLLTIAAVMLTTTITLRYFIQQHSSSYTPYYFNTFSHLDPLVLGILVAFLWNKCALQIKRFATLLLVGALAIFFTIFKFMPDLSQNAPSIVYVMTVIAIGFALFLLSILGGSVVKKLFTLGPVTSLGRITYGMYIFHYPVLMSFLSYIKNHPEDYANKPLQVWMAKFAIVLSVTFLLALISWNLYEKPFNKLRKKFLRSRSTEPEPTISAEVAA